MYADIDLVQGPDSVIMLRPEGQLTVTVTFQTFFRFARIVLDTGWTNM